MSDTTNSAAAQIMTILEALPSPRHAAATIAVVRANLFIQGGAMSSADVCRMMDEDDRAAFQIWETIDSNSLIAKQ
jgi:hypothetical protein